VTINKEDRTISDRVGRYRRATTKSHQQRVDQEAPGMPLPRVCEENGAASGGIAASSTPSSGQPSMARVPTLAMAARPSEKISSFSESDRQEAGMGNR
jgi:hypothetical protein